MINLALVAVVVGLSITVLLLLFSKSFNKLLEKVVVLAENELKGKSGKEKLQFVLKQIKHLSWIANLFTEKKLITMIDKLVDEFNKFNSK